MSRKQPIYSYSVFVLSCLVIAFFLVVQQRVGSASAQLPAPPSGQNPLALIKTIVVQGSEVEKAGPSQVTIARAGVTSGAEPGTMLYVGDHVTTGAGVKLTILFLDEAAEKDNEVVVDAMTHVQVGSLFNWAGRILARVKDKFQTRTARAQWSVVGTEYELVVQPDGTNVLRVLKGEVRAETGTFFPPTASLNQGANRQGSTKSHHPSSTGPFMQDAMSFVAFTGKVIDVEREFILTNSCQDRHVYRVTSPLNLNWFQFLGADQFAIDGKGTRNIKFAIRLDARNVPAGAVDSQITFPCLDCNNEPGCRIGGLLLPITMKVMSSGAPAPPPSPTVAVTPIPTPVPDTGLTAVTAVRMQEVILPPAGNLQQREASPEQIDQTLNWSNPVIVPGEPTYSAQSIAPHYQTWDERDRVFRAARRSAIINDDRRSRQILADVYIDWGNGAKAEEELKGVEVRGTELPARLVTLGEARRLMGDLASAESLLRRAIGLEPTLAHAYNALGNVYLDQAKAEQDKKNYAAARNLLEKAKAEYAKAIQTKSGAPPRQHHVQTAAPAPTTPSKTDVVAQSNLGEVHLRLGEIARATNDKGGALREYQSAEQAFDAAAQKDATYQFAFNGLGDVYRELGETQEELGNQSRAQQYYARSQDQYSQALRLHRDMAEAHVGLGRVFEDTGRKDEALRHFYKATQVRPELPDPHYRFAVALSESDPARAAEQARAYLKLERAPLKQGERAQNARDVASGRAVPGKTVVPGVSPTPPREDSRPREDSTPTSTTTTGSPVKIPSMNGDRPEKALEELRGKGLVGRLRDQRDCEATGKVVGTEPGSGKTVPAGSEVIVFVSAPGENAVTMPSLRRVSRMAAEERLRSLDLLPSIKTRETDRDPPQTVISQKPDAGKQLPAGCTVELTVAIPIPPVVVNNFVGRNMQEIYSLLAGLSVGVVNEVDSQQPGGTILAQSLSPGTTVPRGTSIDLQVAAVVVYVPDVMNLSRQEAEKRLKNGGLSAQIEGQPGPNSFVHKQDPAPQTPVRRGTRVRLWFSVIDGGK